MPGRFVSVERINREQLRAELDGLEREHGMTSGIFLDRWTRGELDDPQLAWWAALCRMAIRARVLDRPSSVPSAFPETTGAVLA